MSSMYITEPATSGKVCLSTTVGDIDIELWCKECPLACRNFIQLCMESYYNNVIFHRLVKDFIVQTGDPTGTGEGGDSIYDCCFKTEFHQRLQFNRRGLVGMASEKRDSNTSQFFFTFAATPELNKKHTLFGKVVGNTLFNMLKLNECDVDQNDRPTRQLKILGAEILLNPFNDIKPRVSLRKEQKEEKKTNEKRKTAQKNTNLLSFGDEFEDEEDLEIPIKKFKSKSAHDVLDDELLSKEKAVHANEIGEYSSDEEINNGESGDESAKVGRLDRIREKMRAKKGSAVTFDKDSRKRKEVNDDEDLDNLIDTHKEAEKQAKLKEVSDELKSLQKEYVKMVRGPKKAAEKEETISETMQSYNKMKLKFKSGSKNIVKSIDEKREAQTTNLLKRFTMKMDRASVGGILMDKMVDISDLPSREQAISAATAEDQGKIELDVEDITVDDWMSHSLVAPQGIRKDARDANLKDTDKEWYPIDDPRNHINVSRRAEE